MNKWFYTLPLAIFTLLFVMTIGVTLSNPSSGNIMVSMVFLVGAIMSFILFNKSMVKDSEPEPIPKYINPQPIEYSTPNYPQPIDTNNQWDTQ